MDDLDIDEDDILDGLFRTAIIKDFDALYKLSDNDYMVYVMYSGIELYKPGNERLRILIDRCIRNSGLPLSLIGQMLEARDFDDAIVSDMENWEKPDGFVAHTVAIAQGREDFAKRIEPYLK